MRPIHVPAAIAAAFILASCAAQPIAPTAQRIYALDCGQNSALDQSRWSPGVNAGVPIVLSDNCYVIRHAKGVLLWDTGYPDALTGKSQTGALGTATRAKSLAAQLAEIGLKPSDVNLVAVSHTHGDHVGNVAMFAGSRILIQRAEYDWAFGAGRTAPFPADVKVEKLDGDLDVFGDGSVMILSTPGHTLGHQSLRVRLAHTGTIVLSGDAAHFRDNWENRRVPSMNTSADATRASLERIAGVLKAENGTLWINHDLPQSRSQRRSPEFYD
ncbi:MAG: MBL fold metallo-hydrolase [Alphaproteobacteria bacterium]|nr:MBL fold metallo-hydrolase [Alphaproteobacteria bacterium]